MQKIIIIIIETPWTFYESFKVNSIQFFIPDFNLLSCEFDNYTFKVFYWVVLH